MTDRASDSNKRGARTERERSDLRKTRDGCSLSPRERVRVRGKETHENQDASNLLSSPVTLNLLRFLQLKIPVSHLRKIATFAVRNSVS